MEEIVQRAIQNPEAAEMVLKQLAYKNGNPTCQALLRPIRRTGTINDYVRACLEASPAYIQGVAMAVFGNLVLIKAAFETNRGKGGLFNK